MLMIFKSDASLAVIDTNRCLKTTLLETKVKMKISFGKKLM